MNNVFSLFQKYQPTRIERDCSQIQVRTVGTGSARSFVFSNKYPKVDDKRNWLFDFYALGEDGLNVLYEGAREFAYERGSHNLNKIIKINYALRLAFHMITKFVWNAVGDEFTKTFTTLGFRAYVLKPVLQFAIAWLDIGLTRFPIKYIVFALLSIFLYQQCPRHYQILTFCLMNNEFFYLITKASRAYITDSLAFEFLEDFFEDSTKYRILKVIFNFEALVKAIDYFTVKAVFKRLFRLILEPCCQRLEDFYQEFC